MRVPALAKVMLVPTPCPGCCARRGVVHLHGVSDKRMRGLPAQREVDLHDAVVPFPFITAEITRGMAFLQKHGRSICREFVKETYTP